jgi:formylglycine-generating enzyme required for sulfatase activity
MAKIFLSYRRQDSAGVAGRICDRLRAHFGDDAVFIDIDSIPFGEDFRKHVDSAFGQCDLVLVVIGPKWAGENDVHRRLDDPKDFVRIEIESALKRDIPVIPVLIDRTKMPKEAELPPSIAGLTYRNAIDVDQGRDFDHHVHRLVQGIESHFEQAKTGAARRSSQPGDSAPKRPIANASEQRNKPWRWLYVAVVPLLVVLGIITYTVTDDGTVKITGTDASMVVRIDNRAIRIEKIGEPISLHTGPHDLLVTRGELVVATQTFPIQRGQETLLKVSYTPKPPATEIADRKKRDPPSPTVVGETKSASPTTTVPTPEASLPRPGRAWTNSIGMKFVCIEAGEFLMGTTNDQVDQLTRRFPDSKREYSDPEQPQHLVKISRPFLLGIYEVTVGEFKRFVESSGYQTEAEKEGMDKGSYSWVDTTDKVYRDTEKNWRKPGFPQTDEHPVVCVSHNDALAFCEWLKREEGRMYRLPTEAEWEFACRAGTTELYFNSNDPESLATMANVADATLKLKYPGVVCIESNDGYPYTAAGRSLAPNRWGLYHTIGNVSEWCADWFDGNYYRSSPLIEPINTSKASYFVVRGAGWNDHPKDCRAAIRFRSAADYRSNDLGFRLAANQE